MSIILIVLVSSVCFSGFYAVDAETVESSVDVVDGLWLFDHGVDGDVLNNSNINDICTLTFEVERDQGNVSNWAKNL